jgi:hypothetical protein
MHYVTHRSHNMQKNKFGITCPGALFIESVPVPPELEKYCIDILQPRHTGIHCVTRIIHWM